MSNLRIRSEPRIFRCEAGWSWQVPSLSDHDLWCVLAGRGWIRVDDRRFAVAPGTCWVLEPGARVQAGHDPADRLRVLAVHFDPCAASGRPRRLRASERPDAGVQVEALGVLESLSRHMVSAYRRGDALGRAQAELCLRQLLLLLLQESARPAAQAEDLRVLAVYDAVLEEPGRDWPVARMAQQAHLSRSQFTRRFRAATGRSPARCVIEARVQRAGVLLRASRMPIGEIADALGYGDIFHFSRQFKSVTGQTPSAYRADQMVEG